MWVSLSSLIIGPPRPILKQVQFSLSKQTRALVAKVNVSSDMLAGHGQGPGHYIKVPQTFTAPKE